MRRRLTPIERIMWTLGETFPVAIAAIARVQGHRDPEEVRAAVAAVSRRHPMLTARVADAGLMNARLTTDGVPEPPLRTATGRWQDAITAELRIPFDTSAGPLVRYVLLDHGDCFDLAIVCHHLVGDGLSLLYVLRDLIAHLTAPHSREPAAVIEAPPMHDLVRAMPRPGRPERFKQAGSTWPVRPRTSAAEFVLLDQVLAQEEGRALQERCRAEGTSVHAALAVAGLRALADLDGATSRQLYSPVNLRPLLPGLPEGACGTYAVELFTWFDVAMEPDFWPAARRLKQTLVRQTAPERLLRQVRLLSIADAVPNAVMRRLLAISCKPFPSFSLSNLGRLPFPAQQGDLRIEGVHAGVHMGTLTNGLLAAVTVDDLICLTLSTSEPDRPAAELTMKAMLGHLRTAL